MHYGIALYGTDSSETVIHKYNRFLKNNFKKPLGSHFHMYCQFMRSLYCAVHSCIALYGTENCFSETIIHNYYRFSWAIYQNQLQESSRSHFHMYCRFIRTLYCAVHSCAALYGTENWFSETIIHN